MIAIPLGDISGSGRSIQVDRAGRDTLVNAAGRLVAVDEDGKQRWVITERVRDIPTLRMEIVGGVAVVSQHAPGVEVFPDRLLISGVDIDSGRVLWKDTTSAFVEVVQGTVITSECAPQQTGRLGECTVTARDATTGRAQWQQPSYASARVTDPLRALDSEAPEELWVTSYPKGADSERWDAFDLESGKPLGGVAGDRFTGTDLLVAPGRGVFFADDSDAADNSCTPSITALEVPGRTQSWVREFTLGTYPSADGKEVRCSRLDVRQQDGTTASVTDRGRPCLLDLRTGRTVWDHAAEGETLLAVTREVVLTRSETPGDRLIARSRYDGRDLWTDDRTVSAVTPVETGPRPLVLVDTVVDGAPGTLVMSPESGDVKAAAPGTLVGHAASWFATYVDPVAARRSGQSPGMHVYMMA